MHQMSMSQMGQGSSGGQKSFFVDFLKSSKLDNEGTLQDIRPANAKINNGQPVLGVDGGFLVKSMIDELAKNEPNYFLSHLLPFEAKNWLKNFYDSLTKQGVKPVFVFDGMPVEAVDWTAARGRPPQVQWNNVAGLQNHFNVPNVRQPGQPAPSEPFPIQDPLAPMTPVEKTALQNHVNLCELAADEDAISYIIRFLISLGAEVFRAPYWAWPQLIAFLAKTNRYIGDVYGSTEILAFDYIDRLVLEVDAANNRITYVSREDILEEIKKSHSNQEVPLPDLSAAILCDSQHRFFKFFTCAQTIRHMNFNSLLQQLTKEGMSYIQSMPKLAQIQCAVKSPLVINARGDVETLQKVWNPKQDAPAAPFALKDIYGTRLPSCFYFFLFCNVISPQILVAVVSSKIHDPPVLVETKEGKIAVERVLPLRTQIVFQLVQQLAQNAAQDQMTHSAHNYFNNDFSLTWIRNAMPVPILRPPQIKLDEWTGIRGDESASFTNVLVYAVNAARDAQYGSVKEAIAAVHLKSLDLLGYFTHATHSNSHEVSGKSVYSEALSFCQEEPDYAVLLIELLRTRSLTDAPYTTINDSSTVQLADGVRFFCRLVSLVPVELKSPYTGPSHTGLLAFNTIVRHLHRTLRSLSEVVGLTLFLENRTTFGIASYGEFPNELPFREPPGIIAGVIAFFIMVGPTDAAVNDEWDSITTHARRYEYLATVFSNVADIKKVIADVFHFWDVGVNMLIQLHQDETPTVEAQVTRQAVDFHNAYVVSTAAKYDIQLQPKEVPVPAQHPQYY